MKNENPNKLIPNSDIILDKNPDIIEQKSILYFNIGDSVLNKLNENKIKINKNVAAIELGSIMIHGQNAKKKNQFDFTNLESDFNYNFCDCFRSCFCYKDRKTEIYDFASEHLDIQMDFETLIEKYNEIDMLKKFIFDDKQIQMFKIISKFSNVHNFFSSIDKEEENVFKDYEKERVEQMFDKIKDLIQRNSKKDGKLISKLRDLFKLE